MPASKNPSFNNAGDLKIRLALRILGVAPKVGEKGGALRVHEKRAS